MAKKDNKKTTESQFEARTIPQETSKSVEKSKEDLITEVMEHYAQWLEDNERNPIRRWI